MFDDNYRIIKNQVPAKYLFTDGNSIHEFGYDNGNFNEVYKNTKHNVKLQEITYDNNGDLIPLDKRFDEAKSDIKYSRQVNNAADNIEQLKAENESFSEYVDEVVQELQSKLKNKKQPDVVKIFDHKELYKIAAKYNTYYEPNKNGGFSKKQYSNTEIADIIENVLSEVSQGKTNLQDAVTRLTAIQENVLQNGYEIEYEPGAKEFRKELRNKPIYLTARDYNQLYILVNLKRIEAGVSKAGKNNPRNTFRPASENGISKAVEPESPETPFARFPSLDYQTSFLLSTHC